MSKENYFQSALSNFIFEFACGGEIRHLASQGCTAKQIAQRLSYPVSYKRVREAVTKYLLEAGILLQTEPVRCGGAQRYIYVQERGKYGKTSFRKVPAGAQNGQKDTKEEWSKQKVTCMELTDRLKKQDCAFGAKGSAAEKIYVTCGFGRTGKEFEGYELLNQRQQEYLEGICWDAGYRYHLLDARMKEIVMKLCENNVFGGSVYFGDAKVICVVKRAEDE